MASRLGKKRRALTGWISVSMLVLNLVLWLASRPAIGLMCPRLIHTARFWLMSGGILAYTLGGSYLVDFVSLMNSRLPVAGMGDRAPGERLARRFVLALGFVGHTMALLSSVGELWLYVIRSRGC